MTERAIHPNTKIVLEAWRRMSKNAAGSDIGPQASEHPGVLSHLFVLQVENGGTRAPLRITGEALNQLIGADASYLDFVEMWRPVDQVVIGGVLGAVIDAHRPALLRAVGETIVGHRLDVEIALAPLGESEGRGHRMLGLYQPLGGEGMLGGRTIWTHRLSNVSMPEAPRERRWPRLVANNV